MYPYYVCAYHVFCQRLETDNAHNFLYSQQVITQQTFPHLFFLPVILLNPNVLCFNSLTQVTLLSFSVESEFTFLDYIKGG